MKRRNHMKKPHWTTIWLLSVLALTSVIFATNAAYTEVFTVKRVVSTTSTPETLFSSNCLRASISSRKLTSSEYTITICNFDQDYPTVYNPSEVKYTLHAELQVKSGDGYISLSKFIDTLTDETQKAIYRSKAAAYLVTKTEDDGGNPVSTEKIYFTQDKGFKISFSGETLAAKESSVDKYKVTIDKADLTSPDAGLIVYVWAEETSPSSATIESRLYAATTVTDTASWTGTFLETDCDTVDYDFYNYIISGSGAGTVDILWDPKMFEINDFFFKTELSGVTFVGEIGEDLDPSHTGWNKVTIAVDSAIINRYELQLYKSSQEVISYTDKNAASKFITCKFNKNN